MRKRATCQEVGCGKAVYSRGMCKGHYESQRTKLKRKGLLLPEIIVVEPEKVPGPQEEQALPKTFLEYLEYCVIESDDGYGWVRFELFPYQRELAVIWDRGESCVILKRRQVGMSWLAQHFAAYCGLFKVGHIAILSKGKYEAEEFIRKMMESIGRLPENWQRPSKGVDPVKFDNGNLVHALPSTKDGGISFTFARMFIDEAAMHPYGKANYMQYQATIAKGQLLMFSAANPQLGPNGFFYEWWQNVTGGRPWDIIKPDGPEPWTPGGTQESTYRPIFIGKWAREDQNEKWFAKQKKNYMGDPEMFDVVYPERPEQAFLGKSGLVFPEFSTQLHVSTGHPMAWEDYSYRFASIDPGGGDPTAIVPLGSWRDSRMGVVKYHQPGEFYSNKAVTADQIIDYLAQWHARAPFTRIWIDTAGGEVLLNTLRAYFGKTIVWPAIKDRDMGLVKYREVLAQNRLSIHESCVNGIGEFASYRWVTRPDPTSRDQFTTGTPFDNHADAHDARRYTLLGAETAFLKLAASEPLRHHGVTPMKRPMVRWVV